MSTQRSIFTEAIEDHLALKKQNSGIEQAMPLARFDVGDPLDRYPGGPVRDDALAAARRLVGEFRHGQCHVLSRRRGDEALAARLCSILWIKHYI